MIYTAICGGKDAPRRDIKCFTEEDYNLFRDPCRNAKIFKVLSHLWVDDEVSVWLDGNIFPTVPEKEIVGLLPADANIAVFGHPVRATVAEESETVFGMGLDDKATIWQQQMRHQFMQQSALYECGVIIRRHNSDVMAVNETWWAEICRGSKRDQLSFPIALRKHWCKVSVIPGNVRNHPFFRYEQHAN
jgi:hypothetical protein